MRIILILLFLISSVDVVSGEVSRLQEKSFVKLTYYKAFRDSDTGSVAFLPNVGAEEYLDKVWTHMVLPESGFYNLPKKGNIFFRVNHAASTQVVSYLGVLVYIIYPSYMKHRNPLNLTRNKAAWRAGRPERKLDSRLQGPSNPDVTLVDFFKAHDEQSKLKDCDSLLTFTWHAAVKTGSDFSWKYKSKWYSAKPPPPLLKEFLKKLNLTDKEYEAAITAHILHFTTSKNPRKPVDFWFNNDGAYGAYVIMFSPLGPMFSKEFYLKFPNSQ